MSAGRWIDNNFNLEVDDFILHGETRSVCVDEKCDYNIYKKNFGANSIWFWTFCGDVGDVLSTNRGVTFGDSMSKVFELYGKAELKNYDKDNDVLVERSLMLHENDIGDFKTLKDNEKYCEYSMVDIGFSLAKVYIRFYFGEDEKVKLIGFYNDINFNKF